MKTPEEIKNALECCSMHIVNKDCSDCVYFNESDCDAVLHLSALSYIRYLEETIIFMKAQMHGDCGVCVHRHEQAETFRKSARRGEFAITDTCAQCIKKETRPNWEYDGTDA